MENDRGLNAKILSLTSRIREQHPELSLYLAEMRVTHADDQHPEVNTKNLQVYYDTLKSILTKYAVEYPPDPARNV